MTRKVVIGFMALVVALIVGANMAPSYAATGNHSHGTGSTLRSELRQNEDGTGYWFKTFGTTGCTASTSNIDNKAAHMEDDAGWGNSAEWVADFNLCDTRLFDTGSCTNELTSGWTNFAAGRALSAANQNKANCLELS
jgi:hypothetical protein